MKQVWYPIRVGPVQSGIIINSYSVLKQKELSFIMLQTELGDLFKLWFEYNKDGTIALINIMYFDSIPVANSLCILKTGYILATYDTGNHQFFKFLSIGETEDPNCVIANSNQMQENKVYFTALH